MRSGRHWLRGVALVAVLSAACSAFQSDPDPAPIPPRDDDAAAVDEASAPDAATKPDAAGGGPCARDGLFTIVHKVDGLNTVAAEQYARFSADERVVYFQRTTGAVTSILRAERLTRESTFALAVPVAGLNANGRHPFVTADERTIYYVDNPTADFDTYVARRDAGTDLFGPSKLLPPPLNQPGNTTLSPFFRADGKEVFFTRGQMPGAYGLWRAFPLDDGGFADGAPVDQVNSTNEDDDPVVSEDGLDLYFYSARSSAPPGIWRAHRDSLDMLFRTPTPVGELTPDGGGVVSPTYLSSDMCRLYFSSTQDSSTGADIYVAERLH